MPPPAIAKAEARLKAQKIGGARHSTSPNKVVDRVQKPMPKQQPRIDFLKFPAEIQHMIWAEYFQKPACHTFKFVFQEAYAVPFHRWGMELQPLPDNYDPSAYKRWKRFIWKSHWRLRSWPRANDKPMSRDQHFLANTSFQTGFRRAMIDFQTLEVLVSTRGIRRDSAAIDAATDLTILEFDRGVNAKALHWFEHSTGTMYMNSIRRHMRPLERVAVHYKRSHKNATSRGPFQCYCRSGSDLDCGLYKACPMEQACFLDCFPKLKEFYYVVEVTKKKELAWKDDYKGQLSFPPPDYVRRQGYKLTTSDDPASAPFELQRFRDKKFEYIQLCPERFFEFLPRELRISKAVPLDATVEGGPRECLMKVMDIYKGKLGNETFFNSVEERKKVKFGILFAYPIDIGWDPDLIRGEVRRIGDL